MKNIYIIIILSISAIVIYLRYFIGPTCLLSGDDKSVGAIIYVNGKEAGKMEEMLNRHYDPPRPYAATDLSIKRGEHDLRLIGKDGEILEKRILVKNKCYITVRFSTMEIHDY